MKTILFVFLMIPLNLWANWTAEVAIGVDGETWKIERTKFENGKENVMELRDYILKMTLKKGEGQTVDVSYSFLEKKNKAKGKAETLIAKGEESIEQKATNDIYAKGETNQPNTIITLKLKNL